MSGWAKLTTTRRNGRMEFHTRMITQDINVETQGIEIAIEEQNSIASETPCAGNFLLSSTGRSWGLEFRWLSKTPITADHKLIAPIPRICWQHSIGRDRSA
jgi:hypothetical protein